LGLNPAPNNPPTLERKSEPYVYCNETHVAIFTGVASFSSFPRTHPPPTETPPPQTPTGSPPPFKYVDIPRFCLPDFYLPLSLAHAFSSPESSDESFVVHPPSDGERPPIATFQPSLSPLLIPSRFPQTLPSLRRIQASLVFVGACPFSCRFSDPDPSFFPNPSNSLPPSRTKDRPPSWAVCN